MSVAQATLPVAKEDRRGLLLLILGALSAIGPLSIDMYLPALPAISGEMVSAPAQVQLTLTACLIGVSVGQVVAGPVSDVRGRRMPLLVGVAGFTVASLLCAFAPSVPVLIVLRLLQGMLGGAALVIVRAVVRDLYDGAAIARIFATLMLVSGLAPILAPIAGAQLLEFTSWRGVFVALSLPGLVLLVAVLFGVRETLPVGRAGGRRARAHPAHVLAPAARPLLHGLARSPPGSPSPRMFAYISGSPFVLQEVYDATPAHYSLIFGANALGLTLIAQVGGRLSGRDPAGHAGRRRAVRRAGRCRALLAGAATGLGCRRSSPRCSSSCAARAWSCRAPARSPWPASPSRSPDRPRRCSA